jgi:thiosulfate/3-mercaptopyruvate sulfurtransferase
VQLIDTRQKKDYESGAHNGKGHIPGAINIPYHELIDEFGNTLLKDQLIEKLSKYNLDPTKETITYCQQGVSAAIGYAALQEAGFQNVKLYDDSWAGFSTMEETKHL